jgi:eukaryotic-like serine/threonine-protein kinase
VNPDGQPGQPKSFLGQGSSNEFLHPELSPDGHWMAYASNESGLPQVYVVPFPGPGGKRQISVSGGRSPRWSKAGHELFFIIQPGNGTGALVAVPYAVEGNSFQPGTPVTLFNGGFQPRDPFSVYDVAPDGKHFAMLQAAGGKEATLAPPTVVVNWFTRVEHLVAAGQK